MLTWSNTTSTGASQPTAPASLIVNSLVGYRGVWIPTAADLNDQSGAPGRIGEEATRTATTCFMRGLSEHIRIQTSSGLPWFWRRICFTLKGNDLSTFSPLDTPISTTTRYIDTTNGMERLLFNEVINNQPNTINNQDAIIFKGAKGVDWNDPILAPIDTRRITLKYDKTMILKSGNQVGTIKECKLWHGMSHNLVYGDDESGDGEVTSYVSTTSKAGMGDYYVMDLIFPGTGGTTSDVLQMSCHSTLYWHER